MKKEFDRDGRLQVAVALHLLRQWKVKDGPKFDPEVLISVLSIADHLGVREEYDDLVRDFPRYRFVDIDA